MVNYGVEVGREADDAEHDNHVWAVTTLMSINPDIPVNDSSGQTSRLVVHW